MVNFLVSFPVPRKEGSGRVTWELLSWASRMQVTRAADKKATRSVYPCASPRYEREEGPPLATPSRLGHVALRSISLGTPSDLNLDGLRTTNLLLPSPPRRPLT